MSSDGDPGNAFDWEGRIQQRAADCGITLADEAVALLADHARGVLRANDELHLTTIVEPEEFLERHLGESFEGAAMLDPAIEGEALDLGTGNGYPGLPIAAAREGLKVALVDSSRRKSEFLRQLLREHDAPRVAMLETQVQRPADLEGFGPFRLVTSRAVGGWPKILPRLAPLIDPAGELLVWAGADAEAISRRVVWRRFELQDRRPLPGRDQSWIWRFRPHGFSGSQESPLRRTLR